MKRLSSLEFRTLELLLEESHVPEKLGVETKEAVGIVLALKEKLNRGNAGGGKSKNLNLIQRDAQWQ